MINFENDEGFESDGPAFLKIGSEDHLHVFNQTFKIEISTISPHKSLSEEVSCVVLLVRRRSV